MIKVLKNWIHRYFSDEQALVLFLLLTILLALVLSVGSMLGPVFVGLILAFLMQGIVAQLVKYKVPHLLAVSLVFILFLGLLFAVIFLLLPLIWNQLSNLFAELPRMLNDGQDILLGLPEKYPQLVSEAQIIDWIADARNETKALGQLVVSYSLSTIANLVGFIIYLVIVPILVFFFLKDRVVILGWFSDMLPKERRLLNQIWMEMNEQIANYVRGKVIEIMLVGVVSYVAFSFMELNYAALLAILVGLSVIIPYIGAAVVTIPVAMISIFQWGWSSDFLYLMLVYGIIQTLDGNLLVPFLFSEVVNLHPVAIIIAVLFFGGLWGLWGVFFAIPLATLIKAILSAWPKPEAGLPAGSPPE
ncbi:MAG: AI-2E family transporter [Pseudomonadales bacterium]|nr:AI-2E family transporter [Pseudomonadales bacterium]